MIDADDVMLVMNGPLTELQTKKGVNTSQRVMSYEGLITSHLGPVTQQIVNVDSKVDHQSIFIWSMLGIISITILIIIIIIWYLYRYYGSFFKKIYDLRERIKDVKQQFILLGDARDRFRQWRHSPVLPSAVNHGFIAKLLKARRNLRKLPLPEGNPERSPANQPSVYISMEHLGTALPERIEKHYHFQTIPEPHYQDPREYPRISPHLRDMKKEIENEELDKESEEVEALCKQVRRPIGKLG